MNEPVAWTDGKGNYFDKNSFFPVDDLIPLYTQPQKYCPSEDNAAYEKGFIDGMAKQRDSAIQRFVEGMSAKTNITDKEFIVFLMDEIDKASQWLIEGQTHMATGILGQCHAEIRKHLRK